MPEVRGRQIKEQSTSTKRPSQRESTVLLASFNINLQQPLYNTSIQNESKSMTMNSHLQSAALLLFFLAAAAAPQRAIALSLSSPTITQQRKAKATTTKDRPLLRQFGRGINERILNSKEGCNRFGLDDHYTSDETIPCLDMQTTSDVGANNNDVVAASYYDMSSQRDIREAYMANDNTQKGTIPASDGIHGRSSGSGCCIIRLSGKDATSVRGLVDFADNFFEGVDNDGDDDKNGIDDANDGATTKAARRLKDLGVFRIANNVHAGFDHDVNEEGKMQVLYTKLIPGEDHEDPLLLPLEVGDMVGTKSLSRAHSGMNTLFDIGSQITSAVLGMDNESTKKLLDDCSRSTTAKVDMIPDNHEEIADTMSNSYQRIIRYLKPKQPANNNEQDEDAENDAAFWPHVDSTFLTLIPMPEIAGLEVWCPSSRYAESDDLAERGEWVRPIKPTVTDENENGGAAASLDDDGSSNDDDCIHVVALAGEFLQLLSDGQVPTCIHRVIAPKPPTPSAFGFGASNQKYKPRVSAPLFLRPRRGEEAVLDVESDLRDSSSTGLYFEKGLMEECDGMRVWDYMDCMSPNN